MNNTDNGKSKRIYGKEAAEQKAKVELGDGMAPSVGSILPELLCIRIVRHVCVC